jgi:hypothetical protein
MHPPALHSQLGGGKRRREVVLRSLFLKPIEICKLCENIELLLRMSIPPWLACHLALATQFVLATKSCGRQMSATTPLRCCKGSLAFLDSNISNNIFAAITCISMECTEEYGRKFILKLHILRNYTAKWTSEEIMQLARHLCCAG